MGDEAARGLGRRQFLVGTAIAGVAITAGPTAWAQKLPSAVEKPETLSGSDIHLTIGHGAITIDGRTGHAITINGTVPGPIIRLKEGQTVRLHITNTLEEDTSIHWHGLLVPFEMDGVPGVSFPGIRPGETFTYDFPVMQSGTYWFHSHSGLQEQEVHTLAPVFPE
jgi:FtsP/CotA-like multicopper oxidase with cupredoxin domain